MTRMKELTKKKRERMRALSSLSLSLSLRKELLLGKTQDKSQGSIQLK